MRNSIFIFPENIIKEIPYNGDPLEYDYQIYKLSFNFDGLEFLVINPLYDKEFVLQNIDIDLHETTKITIWKYKDNWLAKYFTKEWIPSPFAYEEQQIDLKKSLNLIWEKNPDLDPLMQFDGDIFECYEPEVWNSKYKLVWYLDPRVNPLKEKVWAFSCEPADQNIQGIKHMGYVMPSIEVKFNKYFPKLNIDPNLHYPPFWELEYENYYELDPVFQTEPDTWILKYKPKYRKHKIWKFKGYITPELNIEYNPVLGELDYDIDYQIPWHDLGYEHTWILDRSYLLNNEEDIWAFKLSYSSNSLGNKIIDYIKPTYSIEYNPVLGKLDYDIDYQIPWHDLGYEHTWILDRSYLLNNEEDIWAFKIKCSNKVKGTTIVDYIKPNIKIKYNNNLSNIKKDVDYQIPWYEIKYEHIFTLDDDKFKDKIWVTSFCATEKPIGKKYVGKIEPIIEDNLDVIFISYNEPNAEHNWNRLLKKAPWAKRVSGVKGIFNAHKEAARISKTDMFYVVDGDAYIVDEWNFDFQPNIFDRDCAYVWASKNPINDLIYQNGGVKLFSKSVLMKKKKWKTLDMFTGIMPKIKTENTISCITKFNVDEFSTWRSAFRECVKLYINNQISTLDVWLSKGKNRKYGKYAIQGANDALEFVKANINNQEQLLKINDYDWLKNKFNETL